MPANTRSLFGASAAVRKPGDDTARRLAQLEAAARRWLGQGGSPDAIAAARDPALDALLEAWLPEVPAGQLLDKLPELGERLGALLPATSLPGPDSLLNAFAHALVAQAMAEVALEAARAGHIGEFSALSRHLDADPSATELGELSRSLHLGESTIAVALSRLRRRLQQRIEAALALWASPGEARNALRRKLRESLTGMESTR